MKTIADLLAVMAALRTPGTGCPWDLAQTFRTIAPYTIEEAYEVADAIERGDLANLKDELGDLLFQVVYHARMAEEAGAFAFADVLNDLTEKMIRRHPHVFGSADERAAGATEGSWERIKASEKTERNSASEVQSTSLLADVPMALPALTRAVKLQNKAAEVGFDWPSLAPVFEKMREELSELEATFDREAEGSGSHAEQQSLEEEFGDLLFVIANVARHLEIDPEASLRAANQKFVRRFASIETALAGDGRSPAQSTLEEMDQLWDEAKAREREDSASHVGSGDTPNSASCAQNKKSK